MYNQPIKNSTDIFSKYKYIVFFDCEATQFSQELIRIGAVKCVVKDNGILETTEEFQSFVQPIKETSLSKFIISYTGITDAKLKQLAIPFEDCLELFFDFVGDMKNTLFVAYGNFDKQILLNSIDLVELETDKLFQRYFLDNILDFSMFLYKYVRTPQNNSLSLVNAVKELGGLPLAGSHNPLIDAKNLQLLFILFLNKKELISKRWLQAIVCVSKDMPECLKLFLNELADGEMPDMNSLIEHISLEI